MDIHAYIEEHFPEFKPHAEWLLVPPEKEEVIERYPEAEHSSIFQREDWRFDKFSAYGYYLCMRLTGSTHRFAETIVMRQFPMGMTDDIFFSGIPMLRDQCQSDGELKRILDAAAKQGFKPNPNSLYMPNLARFKGDRQAFVSRTDGRDHIKKVLQERGWSGEGDGLKVEGRQNDPGPGQRLGEDLIAESIQEAVKGDPKLGKLSRTELREHVIEKHALPPEK